MLRSASLSSRLIVVIVMLAAFISVLATPSLAGAAPASSIRSTTLECPAGYQGSAFAADCTDPGVARTASLVSGSAPNLLVFDGASDGLGSTWFQAEPGVPYQLWPGIDSASEAVLSIDCASYTGEVDANGAPIGTAFWPDLAASGYQVMLETAGSVECTFYVTGTDLVPPAEPADPAVAFVSSFVLECPAGYAGTAFETDCAAPASTLTATLVIGAAPNMTTLQSDSNASGGAFFNVDSPGANIEYGLWPGYDSAVDEVLSVGCTAYFGEVDGAGNPIGTSFVPEEGGTGYGLELTAGESIECVFVIAPYADQVPAEPADPAVAFVSSFVLECPAGYTGTSFETDCAAPASTLTANLAIGTVPNQTSVQADTNASGGAFFTVEIPADPDQFPTAYALWPGVDSSAGEIVSATCVSYLGEVDADGNPVGEVFAPAPGGNGYGLELAAGESVECSFAYVPFAVQEPEEPSQQPSRPVEPGAGTDPTPDASADVPSQPQPAASESTTSEPTTTRATTGSGSGSATSTGTISLPNTGVGSTVQDTGNPWKQMIIIVVLAMAGAVASLKIGRFR